MEFVYNVRTNTMDLSSLCPSERKWVDRLRSPEYGQEHLLQEATSINDIRNIVAQVEKFEKWYPGGLLGYIRKARALLREAKDDVNPFEGYRPEVPLRERLITGTPQFMELEKLGLSQLQQTAFVLVAGGLGERLGCPEAKVSLPTQIVTGVSFIAFYIQLILACEVEIERSTGKRPRLPLTIMTSDDTHQKTLVLLADHNRFGLVESQLIVVKQEKVPAFIDNDARLVAEREGDVLGILAKPHGHGDIHTLLNQYQLPRRWVDEGKKWLVFFQDTNILVSYALAVLLGASEKHSLAMNSLTVPRTPGEAVGAVCRLVPTDERDTQRPPITINVEYNRFAAVLAASGLDGDVSDPNTGYSRFTGNTNVLVFHLPRYRDVLEKTGGSVPEFVNPKYADASKTRFKSSARLECLMQDFPRLLDPTDRVGVTELDRWACFSTVKNNIDDAAAKSRAGLPPECAFSAEADFYAANCKYLALAAESNGFTADIAPPVDTIFGGVKYQLGPKVVLLPSFGFCLQHLKERICGPLKLHPGASLVLDGNVKISGLEVDGALQLRGGSQSQCLCIHNLTVQNKGFEIVPLDGSNSNTTFSPYLRMRGYTINKVESTDIFI